MIFPIESRSNEKIKTAQKLSSSASFRLEKQEFFLEGVRLCCDAAQSGVLIKQCFFTEKALEKNGEKLKILLDRAESAYSVSEEIAQKLSGTKTSQGVFAVCGMSPATVFAPERGKKYIALENIQDPSNLGAIIRTAEALGIDKAVLCSCCDRYNPKAQRAAMGSLLRLPVFITDNMASVIAECEKAGILPLATVPDSSAVSITQVDMTGGVIAVIGNEGNGVTQETMALCKKVTVPMKGRAESLNASMAAAVVMWEMMRPSEVVS